MTASAAMASHALRIALLAGLLVPQPGLAKPGTIENGTWRITIPDGFERGEVANTWTMPDPNAPDWAHIELAPLGGPIGREAADLAIVEKRARKAIEGSGSTLGSVTVEPLPWKSFTLECIVMWRKDPDGAVVMFVTQVPTVPEATQLQVLAQTESVARRVMRQLVDSLDGRTNWLSNAERVDRLAGVIGSLAGVAMSAAGFAWWRRKRMRRQPPDPPSREMRPEA